MSNKNREKVQFEVKARKVGNSTVITLPPEILKHNKIEEGDMISIQAEHGEHGAYSSFWNPEKQKGEE